MNFNKLLDYIPALAEGSLLTILLTVVSVIFGMILGLMLALGRISKSKIVDKLCWFYIWIFRGTPLVMQIYFIYYALPMILPSLTLDRLPAAFIALSLNSGAYLAEIIRAAIQSIDKGQMEAAKALGMSYAQAMRRIIVPQSYRRLIPPVGNEFIALLKDSALVSVISLTELARTTSVMANSTGDATIYIPAAIMYLAMTTLLTYGFDKLEKKYSVYE